MSCDFCNDRGVVITDSGVAKKCSCKVKKELEIYLEPLLKYKLDKSVDITKISKSLSIKGGDIAGFYGLVKSFLFLRYFQEQPLKQDYFCITGVDLVETQFQGTPLDPYYEIPFLTIDLTNHYKNSHTGELIRYTLGVREDKPTWIYYGGITASKLKEIYGEELYLKILELDTINIDAFCERNK